VNHLLLFGSTPSLCATVPRAMRWEGAFCPQDLTYLDVDVEISNLNVVFDSKRRHGYKNSRNLRTTASLESCLNCCGFRRFKEATWWPVFIHLNEC